MKVTIIESKPGDGLLTYAKGQKGEKMVKKLVKKLRKEA